MAAAEPVDQSTHPESILLPWYLNGTLSESERHQVTHHLTECANCRAELEELKALRQQVRAVCEEEERAPTRAFQATMAEISRISIEKRSESSYSASYSWLHSLDNFLRSLLQPQWVPTIVSIALLTQLGLLYFDLRQAPSPEQVSTRNIASPSAQLRIVFIDSASERDIRSTLDKVNGHIVNGPTVEGTYIIEIQAVDRAVIEAKIAALRQDVEVIRSVEQIHP